MQQPCSKCGYSSDRPARFCRNCGAPLFTENDATSASTRNYGGNQPSDTDPNRPWTTSGYPYNQPSGAQPPDTARFYRPPAVQDYGMPQPKKSSAKTWLLVALAIVLVIGGALSMLTFTVVNRVRDNVRNPGEAIMADVERQIEEQIRRAEEQARRAEEQVRRAEERARQAGEGAVIVDGEPPAPPAPPAPGAPATLERFKYPNARIERTASFIGNEFLVMKTTDGVATVSQFYQKLVGQPAIKDNQQGEDKVVFQIQGSPSTLIAISPDEETPGQTQIAVIRSRINIPKLNIKLN